jgi:hypothetical protein
MTTRIRIINDSPDRTIRAVRTGRVDGLEIGLPLYLGHEDEALLVLRDTSESIQIVEINSAPDLRPHPSSHA